MSPRSKLFALLLAGVSLAAGPSRVEYFTNVRDVEPVSANAQNYVSVDRELWEHARYDLGDVRLYDNSGEVPFALQVERTEAGLQQHDAKVLNLGTVGWETEFTVDVADVPEYDALTLELSAKNFVAQATIEAADELPAARWSRLGTGTLFDFTREKLGNNFTLRFPPSRFRYLRVKIASGVNSKQVHGATIAMQREHHASWTAVPTWNPTREVKTRDTVRTVDAPRHMPVERIEFAIAPSAINFRREVEVRDNDNAMVASGAITRVRLRRGTTTAEKESLAIDLPSGSLSSRYQITVRNGDDRQLPIDNIRLLSLERRIYFTPPSADRLRLFYGDHELTAPTYDYAKLFTREPNARAAHLAPGRHNPQYTGRPDERPWTERHKWVLWIALILAVLGLGSVALRSMKATA